MRNPIIDELKKLNLISEINFRTINNKTRDSKIKVIKHALIESEKKFKTVFDYIVDLDVTSPLRSKKDILDAIKIISRKKKGNLISGYDARRNPFFNQVTFKNNKLSLVCKTKKPIVRRQDAPKIFDLNASIYMWTRKRILT